MCVYVHARVCVCVHACVIAFHDPALVCPASHVWFK